MTKSVFSLAVSAMIAAAPLAAQNNEKADSMDGPPKGLEAKPSMRLGADAPPLKVSSFVKGSTVSLEKGKTYVVEFWATWCPPCRMSIPHLTKMQKEFADKGVTFIGVTNEDASEVEPFVKKQGAEMDYTVAVDEEQKTTMGYMGAFGIRGIPNAFIVNKDGKVVWHGHPMGDLKKTLTAVLEGSYDMAKAQRALDASALLDDYMDQVMKGDPKAKATGEKILADGADDPMLLGRLSAIILQAPNGDKALALKVSETAMKANTENDPIVYLMHSNALEKNGKSEDAVKTLEKGIGFVGSDQPDLKKALEKELQELKDRVAEPAKDSASDAKPTDDVTTPTSSK